MGRGFTGAICTASMQEDRSGEKVQKNLFLLVSSDYVFRITDCPAKEPASLRHMLSGRTQFKQRTK